MAWLDVKGKSNLTDTVGREEAEERRENTATSRPGVRAAYWDTYPVRRWKGKQENVEERHDSPEGRKEGREGTI